MLVVTDVLAVRCGTGPAPSCASAVATGCAFAGRASAAAGDSDTSEPSPFTTARYAPAAPVTVSNPNALTATALRGGRRRRPYALDGSSIGRPPKVLIPVEVMSGPPEGGSAGCLPRS
ncbi:MAG: hypothetical protein ABW022_21220 [Actinoplanes sp.]